MGYNMRPMATLKAKQQNDRLIKFADETEELDPYKMSVKQLMDVYACESIGGHPSSKSVHDMSTEEIDQALFESHMSGHAVVDWKDLKF